MPDPNPTPTAAAPAAPAVPLTRGHRKERVGEVLSNRMNKTIVVQVQRRFPHARYEKVITRYSKLYAHDEKQEARIGDSVRLEECRPLSRTKRWRLVEVLRRNEKVAIEPAND